MKLIIRITLLFSLFFSTTGFASGGGGGGSSNYLPLTPPFVVNIQDGNTMRFLQITSEVKLTSPDLAEKVKHHMPAIRHAMLMLLTEKTPQEIESLEGKEQLRSEALERLQAVLENETGDSIIERIYFTGFIIQ